MGMLARFLNKRAVVSHMGKIPIKYIFGGRLTGSKKKLQKYEYWIFQLQYLSRDKRRCSARGWSMIRPLRRIALWVPMRVSEISSEIAGFKQDSSNFRTNEEPFPAPTKYSPAQYFWSNYVCHIWWESASELFKDTSKCVLIPKLKMDIKNWLKHPWNFQVILEAAEIISYSLYSLHWLKTFNSRFNCLHQNMHAYFIKKIS